MDFKPKTDLHWSCAAKEKRKAIRADSMLWSSIPKRKGHTKINAQLRNLFIIGFYNILRLCSIQLPMIALKCLLMVPLSHSLFQISCCKCLSGNFIVSQWVPKNRFELRSQEMQKIIPSLVILHYDQFCHPNLRICLHGTKSCVVVSSTYLPKLFIHHYYYGVIFFEEAQKFNSKSTKHKV